MEINPFILALSKTLPESCLQGLVVYLLLQLYFFIDKRSTPLLKFNLFYLANLFLFTGFVYTFFHHYQQIQVTSSDLVLSPNIIKTNYPTSAIEPNLWLKISFWTNHYAYLITGFYLLGLLFCMLKLTIGIINISWFRSNKNLKLDDYLTQSSIRLGSNFKLIKTVSVFVSDKISVPLTLGFIKPIIVFPIALVNQLSAEQTEAILLHELAHIKRNDYLLNLLLCVVQSFLFYNPAIWLMQREINKYREHCCDDLVLDQTQNQLAYAHALLLIEQYRSQSLNLSLASNGKKYTLLNRIKRITNMRTKETSHSSKLLVLLFTLIVFGVCVAWILPKKKAANPYKMKRLNFTVYRTSETGFNPAKPYAEWSADTMKGVRKNINDSFLIYTSKIVYKPNKKYSKKYIFSGDSLIVNNFSGNRFLINEFSNTAIHAKKKYKITVEDSTGIRNKYNSINELPEADQKEFLKEKLQPNNLKEFSISLKFPDSTKYTYRGNYADTSDLKKQTKKIVLIAKKQIANYKNRVSNLHLNEQEKNRKRLVDSARKNWKNASDYQSLPASTPVTIKPE